MNRYKPFQFTAILILVLFSVNSFARAATQDDHLFRYKDYNIVLVYIDTLRADHLGCYGYSRNTLPNIDKLASEAIIFTNNFTPVTYTLASFMSIITSLYPKSHGVLEAYKDKIPSGVKTLPQILRFYGYKTAWFGPNHDAHLDPRVGFGLGFDEIKLSNYSRYNPAAQGRLLCAWLEANKDSRFFLNFHTYKPHDPYFPSLSYRERFSKRKQPTIPVTGEELGRAIFEDAQKAIAGKEPWFTEIVGQGLLDKIIAMRIFEGGFAPWKLSSLRAFFAKNDRELIMAQLESYVYWSRINLEDPEVKKYVVALYDAAILEFDSAVIGPLVAKLKQLGLYDKTVIVICSDHGEEFFEHSGHGHGPTLYEEVTRVPLIIKAPWIKRGRKIDALSQTTDIMPTLLDLLGMVIPAQAQGKSLAGLINNTEFLPPHKYVFGQRMDKSSIRSGKWSLILNDEEPGELYQINLDPGQQHNLYSEKKKVSAKLTRELNGWESSLKRYQDKECAFPDKIDVKTREKIRKTGYW
jgi:arylsulfatase A-like enzyme